MAFKTTIKRYYAVLKKDALIVPSQDTKGDCYVLDLEIYTTDWNFVVEKINQPYIDEKKIYKDQLKGGSKWMATFIRDINTGLMKLKPLKDKNSQLDSLMIPPNEDDIGIIEI